MALNTPVAAREPVKLTSGGTIDAVRVTIDGTNVGTSDTKAITWADLSAAAWLASESVLYLRDFQVAVTAGSATTSTPKLGTDSSPTGLEVIASQTVAQGAAGRDISLMRDPVPFAPGSAIHFVPTLDAGSDNSVSLSILVSATWGP